VDGDDERLGLDREAISSLEELVGGDRVMLADVVDAFLEDAPMQIGELRRGAETGDASLAGRAAHTLKANGRTFGATALAALCQEIEAASRAGDLGPARARIGDLESEWAMVQPALMALRDGDAS
jgi:HPt (histidine-containing phosphotransfer) domain-containing protein